MPTFRSILHLETPSSPARTIASALALVALGLLAMGGVLGNTFVQDDVGVIFSNATAHAWSGVWRSFAVPYWPPVDSGELYRPLSISWFTVQWMVGGGAPWVFRVVSLALYAGSTLLVWRTLRELVPEGAAWVGAALFAVHPVHVEAVAPAVNQSEVVVAILLSLAILLRIRAHRGLIRARTAAIGIAALYVIGLFVKEHALILPGLLLGVDLLVDSTSERPLVRLQRWRWHYAALFVAAVVFWWIRSRILGPGSGTDSAEALTDAGLMGRAYTMLGAPAEWLGLLLWPTHLQTDWNLLEWVPTKAWSLRETAGAIGLVSFGLALTLSWTRRPVTALGLFLVLVSVVPVANILLPTGVIIAERALYLASIGSTLVLADLLGILEGRWASVTRPARLALLALFAAILGTGLVRSAVRVTDWKDRPTFLATLAEDAPTSWHARLALGVMMADLGDTAQGRLEIRRALTLRPDHPLAVKHAADGIRLLEGKCGGPILIYEETLALMPRRSDARGSLVACLLWDGRYPEAHAAATAGVASGLDTAYFRYAGEVADSAVRAGAPAGTVRLKPIGRRATAVGPTTVDRR